MLNTVPLLPWQLQGKEEVFLSFHGERHIMSQDLLPGSPGSLQVTVGRPVHVEEAPAASLRWVWCRVDPFTQAPLAIQHLHSGAGVLSEVGFHEPLYP